MPTAYPFPHVARIALSFLVSVKRVDSVPRIVEVQPWERANIAAPAEIDPLWGVLSGPSNVYEGI